MVKRTIQAPGVEIQEIDASIYPDNSVDSDVLIIGYFSKGPIKQPTKITNLTKLEAIFGTPESEAESYTYYGCKSVFDNNGTCTVVKLPYFNSTYNNETISYKVVNLTLEEIQKQESGAATVDVDKVSNDTYSAMRSLYEMSNEDNLRFQNLKLENSLVSENELIAFKNGSTSSITSDYVIVNKYNDFRKTNGAEIFVSVVGAANGANYQGLFEDLSNDTGTIVDTYYKFDNAAKNWVESDDMPVYEHSSMSDVASAAELTDASVTAANAKKFGTYICVGIGHSYTNYRYTGTGDNGGFIDTGSKMIPSYTNVGTFDDSTDLPEESSLLAPESSYAIVRTVSNSVAINSDNIAADFAKFYKSDAFVITNDTTDKEYLEQIKRNNIEWMGDADSKIYRAFINTVQSSFPSIPLYDKDEIQTDGTITNNTYIDPKKDDFVVVTVGQVIPSTVESGKFTIQTLESFAGSINPKSVNYITKTSDYIGNVVNTNSQYI